MKNTNQLKIGIIISYLTIAVTIVSGIVYTPWMIAQIGQDQYGVYTLANSLISIFLVDFGLSSATGRYVSNFHAEGREDKVASFLGAIYKLYLIIDIVIFLALLIYYFLISKIYVGLTPSELHQFKVVYVIVGLFSVINFPCVTFNGILTAYEQFFYQKILDLAYKIIYVLLMIIALLLGKGLYTLVIVQSAVGLIVVACKYYVIKRKIRIKINFHGSNRALYKEIFSFSLWVTIASLAQRLIFNITPSILGIVSNSAAIAIFGVITTIEGYVYTVSSTINGMFMPRISRVYTQNDPNKKLTPLLIGVGKYQAALTGIIIVGFALVGKQFITLWLGDSYLIAYYGILLVILPSFFHNALQIANTTMIVTNKVKTQAFIYVFMGAINVILSFPLSKILGVLGACISICIAYFVRTFALIYVYKAKMELDMRKFIFHCYIPVIVAMLVTFAICKIGFVFMQGYGWINLSIKVLITIFAYLGAIWLIGLNNIERDTLKKLIKKGGK